jgi:hypothetical protein
MLSTDISTLMGVRLGTFGYYHYVPHLPGSGYQTCSPLNPLKEEGWASWCISHGGAFVTQGGLEVEMIVHEGTATFHLNASDP